MKNKNVYFDDLTPEQQYAATHFGHQSNWVTAKIIQQLENTFKMPGVTLSPDGKVKGVLVGSL